MIPRWFHLVPYTRPWRVPPCLLDDLANENLRQVEWRHRHDLHPFYETLSLAQLTQIHNYPERDPRVAATMAPSHAPTLPGVHVQYRWGRPPRLTVNARPGPTIESTLGGALAHPTAVPAHAPVRAYLPGSPTPCMRWATDTHPGPEPRRLRLCTSQYDPLIGGPHPIPSARAILEKIFHYS